MNIKKFELNILPKSVLLDYYPDISAGRYDCEWNSRREELRMRRQGPGRKRDIVLSGISVDSLNIILLSQPHRSHDYFSDEEKQIIDSIKRRRKSQAGDNQQDHHIIPLDVCKRSSLVIQAIKLCDMNFDDPPNRLNLSIEFHRGSHPKYSDFVEWVLKDHWDDMGYRQRNDPHTIKFTINLVIDYFKDKLKEMESKGYCTINSVFL